MVRVGMMRHAFQSKQASISTPPSMGHVPRTVLAFANKCACTTHSSSFGAPLAPVRAATKS